jgi:t-SNARE complex subunit (syntaxin)
MADDLQSKKPIWKQWWFWLIVVIIVIILVVVLTKGTAKPVNEGVQSEENIPSIEEPLEETVLSTPLEEMPSEEMPEAPIE